VEYLMDDPQIKPGKVIPTIRWIARIWSIISAGRLIFGILGAHYLEEAE
jgi:hypothetical protein